MDNIGDFAEDSTVRIFFSTNNRSGGAVAPSSAFEAADVLIYKDGNNAQKTTTNGLTMTSPFDSITGLHLLEIDTSNDTGDAGFWAAGSDYTVVLSPDETIDSQTVVQVLGQFGIVSKLLGALSGRIPAALVGGRMDANMGAVSGDATAADNLETMLDGTGGKTLKLGNLVIQGSGDAVTIQSTDGTAIRIEAAGAGNGIILTPGATGRGLLLSGGLIGLDISGSVYDISADIQGGLSGTVGGIAGTLQTLDGLWTKIKKWLQLGFRKDAGIATDNATELTEINANGGSGGGAFANTTDSLEALQSEGGGSSAADIWAYATRTLTQGAASVLAAVTGSNITVYRGTTWSISLTGLGDLTTYDTIYFSVKRKHSESDDDAILRLSNAVGLERFNRAAATAANGSLVIDNAALGNITLTVQASITKDALSGQYLYDVKGVDTDGNPVDIKSIGGTFTISPDVTRAVT